MPVLTSLGMDVVSSWPSDASFDYRRLGYTGLSFVYSFSSFK